MRLYDRRAEISILAEAFDTCLKGSGQLVVISGGPGVGKTALLHEFTNTAARSGARTLLATASLAERAQPMGVVRQLLDAHEAPMPPSHDSAKSIAGPAHAVRMMLELARDQPLVIAVDDAHLMDEESLQTLMSLLRRIRRKRILMLCTNWKQSGLVEPLVHADLSRQPHRRVRLAPLSERGVAQVIADQTTQPVPANIGRSYHFATAGNPMLVHALLDDSVHPGTEIGAPVGNVAYRQAVLACLYQGEPSHLRVARAVAVLGALASGRTTALLVGDSPDSVQDVIDLLSSVGILDGYRFRHPAAATAVLSDLDSAERSRLPHEAARMLYLDGAATVAVAKQLVAADQVSEDWGLEVLPLAADEATAAGDLASAASYLELALRHNDNQRERHAISSALVRVEWRLNPAAAEPYLEPLYRPALDGSLETRDTVTVLRHMLWHGDTDQAARALGALRGSRPRADLPVLAEVELIQNWFYGAPRTNQSHRIAKAVGMDGSTAEGANALWTKVALLVSGVVTDESVENLVEALQARELSDMQLELTALSLLVLAQTDRTATAAKLCETLLHGAVQRRESTCHAVLSSVLARIDLLRGDLTAASTKASEYLDDLHPRGWGVLIGLPLSTAILAYTGLGKHENAAILLKQKVPEKMFDTLFGIHYLRAKGHHYLSTDKAYAALSDFEMCGHLMRDREPNLQSFIPWRTDLAQANLSIGQIRIAKEWAEKQLALDDQFGSRSKAVALRVLAAASEPRQRTALLRESIALLQSSGDRAQLTLAYADLSAAYYELGEYSRAHLVARSATQRPDSHWTDSPGDEAAETGSPPTPNSASILTEAESRVAALAALGYTNREISKRIHVTISTVEQHLTHVYRKLSVTRRTELPSKILEHQIPTTPYSAW